jgi:aspartate oxidase
MKQSDYLVIGSGIAGLFFALKTGPHSRLAIVTKKDRGVQHQLSQRDTILCRAETKT